MNRRDPLYEILRQADGAHAPLAGEAERLVAAVRRRGVRRTVVRRRLLGAGWLALFLLALGTWRWMKEGSGFIASNKPKIELGGNGEVQTPLEGAESPEVALAEIAELKAEAERLQRLVDALTGEGTSEVGV